MSGIYGVQNTTYPAAGNAPANTAAAQPDKTSEAFDVAATYEKGETAPAAAYSPNRTAMRELRIQDRAYIQSLQTLVNQLVNQVNQNSVASGNNSFMNPGRLDPNSVESFWDVLIDNGDGTFSWHPDLSEDARSALISRAQEDIGENGYYGVKQTSQRLIDFAKAVTGGDPSRIEEMRDYIRQGFEAVERMFGGKLPEISYRTLNAVMQGLDDWAAGK
jgi:hypothetical protein